MIFLICLLYNIFYDQLPYAFLLIWGHVCFWLKKYLHLHGTIVLKNALCTFCLFFLSADDRKQNNVLRLAKTLLVVTSWWHANLLSKSSAFVENDVSSLWWHRMWHKKFMTKLQLPVVHCLCELYALNFLTADAMHDNWPAQSDCLEWFKKM
jgi:hypothetical protein